MGKLLEMLKKNNIDLNGVGSFKDRKMQEKARAIFTDYVSKLPKEKQYELLSEFLSPEEKERQSKEYFTAHAKNIRDEGDEASRKFLKDRSVFGKSCEEMLPSMEERLRGWVDTSYTQASVSKYAPAEDKMVALFRSETFGNRVDHMWTYVDEKQKSALYKQFLPEVAADPTMFARYMNEPGNFAKGKDWLSFAEKIEASMDEAALKEASERAGAIGISEEEIVMSGYKEHVGRYESDIEAKRQLYLQQAMLQGAEFEPDAFRKSIDGEKWPQTASTVKKIEQLKKDGKLDLSQIVERSKRYIDAAGDDKALGKKCRDAALQNYRELKRQVPAEQRDSEAYQEMERHAAALQAEKSKALYESNKELDKGRELIDQQIATIEKKKERWILSTENSPEHDRMTKSLRLFNAKLDMVLGRPATRPLSEEEKALVEKGDLKDLFDKAKYDTFNYSCLKTKNGTGSIVHEDGRDRNRSARNTFELLTQLGDRIGLSDPASCFKDEMALETLRNRTKSGWAKEHAADYAAKTIYAMSMIQNGVPADKQTTMLKNVYMDEPVAKIKEDPAFKKMVKTLGQQGLCDALIKGPEALALAYADAGKKLADPKAGKGQPAAQVKTDGPQAGGPVL